MTVNGPPGRASAGKRQRVLLVAPPDANADGDVCLDLLTDGLEPTDAVIFVLGDEPPADRFDELERRLDGWTPNRVGFLSLEGGDTSPVGVLADSAVEDVWFDTASTPGDLAGIGVTLSNRLSTWGDAGGVAVCFGPVTTMLEHATVSAVYRFMHVLGQQVRAAGGRVHYHIDPDAHEPVVVHQLKSLCDTVVTVESGGGVAVETR